MSPRFTFQDPDHGLMICCPTCDHTEDARYLHLMEVQQISYGYDFRREGHLIFECESGHRILVKIRNHKGHSIVETRCVGRAQ